jgi:hypothetical protein
MIDSSFLETLQSFIVRAKASCYVGNGEPAPSCRLGSHDLAFQNGKWSYLDSYFGGRDFIGEEVVYHDGQPVWSMNYYGRILLPDLITPAQAGLVIKVSLSRLYREDRFLGGFTWTEGEFVYFDTNDGDLTHYTGKETIVHDGKVAYELVYHGGLIKDD